MIESLDQCVRCMLGYFTVLFVLLIFDIIKVGLVYGPFPLPWDVSLMCHGYLNVIIRNSGRSRLEDGGPDERDEDM